MSTHEFTEQPTAQSTAQPTALCAPRFLAAMAARCPMCHSPYIRPARRTKRSPRWRLSGVCTSCGIRFALNPLQLAMALRYPNIPPVEERQSPEAEIVKPPDLVITLNLQRREPHPEQVTTPAPASRETAELSADLSLLLAQLPLAVVRSVRERWQWLEVRTRPDFSERRR